MKKLKIISKERNEYKLEDEERKSYNIIIELMDIEKELEIGDYIYMKEELLDSKKDEYSTSYIFGNMESKYGRKLTEKDYGESADIIKIIIEEKEIYLKRLYG